MKSDSLVRAIKQILSDGCVFYTVLTLLLYTGGMLASDREREWIPTLGMMFTVLLFSVLFAAVNYTVSHAKLPSVLKLLLHYAVTTVIFYVLFILWGGFAKNASTVLVVLVTYTLLYIIIALLLFVIRYLRGGVKNRSTAYKNQFTDKK